MMDLLGAQEQSKTDEDTAVKIIKYAYGLRAAREQRDAATVLDLDYSQYATGCWMDHRGEHLDLTDRPLLVTRIQTVYIEVVLRGHNARLRMDHNPTLERSKKPSIRMVIR